MKWIVDNCKFGDMIRVKCGAILHYGIYVSDDEVVQFGLPPVGGLKVNPVGVVVCATDIDKFCCGSFVEVGVPDKAERKKRLSPQQTVAAAKSRMGEGGYDVITNNCEHFANECYFGVHRSEQEEAVRGKWLSRSVLDVYITEISDDDNAVLVPQSRQDEVQNVSSQKLKNQKTTAWLLLEAAVKRSFGCALGELKFDKLKNGKWVCDKLWFSISHTDGFAVVAVSDMPCGVDAEDIAAFADKYDGNTANALIASICAKRESITHDTLLCQWIKKESAFKAFGKGGFKPNKINPADYKYKLCVYDGTRIAVCAKNPDLARFFVWKDGGATPIATEGTV